MLPFPQPWRREKNGKTRGEKLIKSALGLLTKGYSPHCALISPAEYNSHHSPPEYCVSYLNLFQQGSL